MDEAPLAWRKNILACTTTVCTHHSRNGVLSPVLSLAAERITMGSMSFCGGTSSVISPFQWLRTKSSTLSLPLSLVTRVS